MSVINANGLCKSYGDVAALDGFDLEVKPGRIVGLIGPNGSGKTTAIKALLGLVGVDGGSLEVLGHDPATQRSSLMARTAYIPDTGILPRWMRIADLLSFAEGVHPSFDRRQTYSRRFCSDQLRGAQMQYWDDLQPGQAFQTGSLTIDKDEILAFALSR